MNAYFVRVCTLLMLVAGLSFTQSQPRLLDKDTFMEMESVGNPAISPDGKRLIFIRTWRVRQQQQPTAQERNLIL